MIDAAGGWLAVVLRLAAITATTGLLGAWTFTRFVLPRVAAPIDDAERRAWRTLATRVAICCAVVALIAALARAFAPGAEPPRTMDETDNLMRGIVWTAGLRSQAILAGLSALLLGIRARRGDPWPVETEMSVIAMAFVQPALAHAGTASDLRVLAYAVDVAHGVTAGAWVGALALVTLLVARTRPTDGSAVRTAALFVAFHPVAVIAAPLVFVTGLATAWLRMGAPEGIANSTYSGLFVAKLLLAGVVGFFGAGHSKLAIKRVQMVAPDTVTRTLAAEVAFAAVVLVVTAVLVGTPPIG